ncbi:hypothetical protein LCGC14_0385890 [marine sediment metagenome]|uniref:Uncharacterized protein n=1 Tax=marine sediment metagenome TaxID=412755 RepID=A0A0F9T0T5_9ZZZZ
MSDREYELKLQGGKVATWPGGNGEDAARRYVDCFRDAVVVAWRTPRFGVHIYNPNDRIIE